MNKTIMFAVVFAFLSIVPSIELLAGSKSAPTGISEDHAKLMIKGAQIANEAFSENDLDKYMASFTDDFISDNVTKSLKDKATFAEVIAKFFKAFPGIKNYQKDLLPYNDYLVFDECTFEIPLPSKNKSIKIFHMDIVEMDGNKLKVKTTFGDGAFMNVALGKIEPPFLKPRFATITVPNPQPTGLVPIEAQNEFQNRWNNHDLPSLGKMLHTNAEILVSPLFDPVDRNTYIGWQELFFKAFPDINMSTQRSYGGDDWAVSEIILRGTNSGPYIGNDSTGKSVEFRAGYLTRFDTKGLITSLKLFIDSMAIMNQLGLEPVSIVKTQ